MGFSVTFSITVKSHPLRIYQILLKKKSSKQPFCVLRNRDITHTTGLEYRSFFGWKRASCINRTSYNISVSYCFLDVVYHQLAIEINNNNKKRKFKYKKRHKITKIGEEN